MDSEEQEQRRRGLMNGTCSLSRVGTVCPTAQPDAPVELRDAAAVLVEPVAAWVCELVVCDLSPRTVRAYCNALLSWFRVLWTLDVEWEQATESDTAAMVGWFRLANNPQRRRSAETALAGTVNVATGKPSLPSGYCASTVNLTLAAVRNFYDFHARWGRGQLVNPVPASPQRRLGRLTPVEYELAFSQIQTAPAA